MTDGLAATVHCTVRCYEKRKLLSYRRDVSFPVQSGMFAPLCYPLVHTLSFDNLALVSVEVAEVVGDS